MKSAENPKPNLIVSACLLGCKTRYDGGSNPVEAVKALTAYFNIIPVCPEVDGGLSTPRRPCENKGESVIDDLGEDKTEAFNKGAQIALKAALKHHAAAALMKERSPSCGSHFIHNGLFDGQVIPGMGQAARLLKQNGIEVFSENQVEELISKYAKKDD